MVTISVFGSDALSGPSQIALLTSTAVCVVLGMAFCGVKWSEIEHSIENKVHETTVSIYILLVIGMLSGAWMISGIVPTLICYGVQIIHPTVFLASACVISAVVSLMTGSSWTTIATIGLALLGIGRALGFSDGWTAGAIISGAVLVKGDTLVKNLFRFPVFTYSVKVAKQGFCRFVGVGTPGKKSFKLPLRLTVPITLTELLSDRFFAIKLPISPVIPIIKTVYSPWLNDEAKFVVWL